MFTQYIVIYEECFSPPVESDISQSARWSQVGKALTKIPWERHVQKMDATWEHRWNIKINTKFEKSTCSNQESHFKAAFWLQFWLSHHHLSCQYYSRNYVLAPHFCWSNPDYPTATISERRQDFRSLYNHFTYGPWTINVFNRQSTVTQYVFFFF